MKATIKAFTLCAVIIFMSGCVYHSRPYGHGTTHGGYHHGSGHGGPNVELRAEGDIHFLGGHMYRTVPCQEVLAFMQATQPLRDWASRGGQGAEVRSAETYGNNYNASCSASATANSVKIEGEVFPIDPRNRGRFRGQWNRWNDRYDRARGAPRARAMRGRDVRGRSYKASASVDGRVVLDPVERYPRH